MFWNRFTLAALTAVKGDFNATSQSEFGVCPTFDELNDNVIQGAYTCSPWGGSSSSTSTSSTSPETTSTPPSGGSSSSLSTGAKIEIGVCVLVAVIALLALLFFWWRRRRANAGLAQSNSAQVNEELTPGPELEGSPVAARLSQMSELDAQDTKITRDSTILAQVELPNEPESNVYHEIPDAPRDIEDHQ